MELVKGRRVANQRIMKLKDDCEKLMIAKFGRIVDLEELESITVNQQLEEVKDRRLDAESERAADLKLWDVRTPSCSSSTHFYHSCKKFLKFLFFHKNAF